MLSSEDYQVSNKPIDYEGSSAWWFAENRRVKTTARQALDMLGNKQGVALFYLLNRQI